MKPAVHEGEIARLRYQLEDARAKTAAIQPAIPALRNVFTYKPGATTNVAAGIYGLNGAHTQQDPALDAAIAATSGPFTIYVDDSLVSPAPIGAPSVAWRPPGVSNGSIYGPQNLLGASGAQGNVTCSAPLPAIFQMWYVTDFTYTGATGFFKPAAGSACGFFLWHGSVSTTGAGFFIDMTNATALLPSGMSIFMADAVFGSGNFYKWNANVTIASSIELWEFSSISANCLSGPNAQIVLEEDAFSRSNCLNQVGITGGTPTPNPVVSPNVAGNVSNWGVDDTPSVLATKGKAASIANAGVNIVTSPFVPVSGGLLLTFQLYAVRSDVDDGANYGVVLQAIAKRAGAAAPVITNAAAPTPISVGDATAIVLPTLAVSGNFIVAQGAGVAGHNYKWTGTCLAVQALESQ